mgnify:CR=1 FL=1
MVDEFFEFDADHDVGAIEAGDEVGEVSDRVGFEFGPSLAGVGPVTDGDAEEVFGGVVRIDEGDGVATPL